MSDPQIFGDIDPADVVDASDPDPEATARIFLNLQRDLTHDASRPRLEDLHPEERALLIFTLALLMARLSRERAN